MASSSAYTGTAKGRRKPPGSEGQHKEALLDEALAETFPASDPISPAYEARLEAQSAGAADEGEQTRRSGSFIAAGLFSVGAMAVLLWLARSVARRQLRL